MNEDTKDMKQTDALLSISMTLLNIAVVLMLASGLWLAHSVIENSDAFAKIVRGGFIY
ncbi:MAG: hypothetical protein R2681_13035 [Pyrinomonadaceae bacterium]